MDLDDPAQLRSELARLYRALEEKEGDCHKLKKQNEKFKANAEITADSQVQGGAAAKKIIELGKKTRALTTELETERTKGKQFEREKKELEKKISHLASQIAAHNIEAGEVYATTSVAQARKVEEQLKVVKHENHELKLSLQQSKLEVSNQKKILETELGVEFVNSSQLLGQGYKGRQQQIIALQARIKELERIKQQQQENPSQIRQVKKDYQDFIEKYKKEIKEKDGQIAEAIKKSQMAKSRIQTLQNQVRVLKEQTLALEEKGRHDDELVEALSVRLKSSNSNTSSDSTNGATGGAGGGVARLESKESISEIKQLRSELQLQQTKYYEQQGQLASAKSQLSKYDDEMGQLQMRLKSQSLERDSLELDRGDVNDKQLRHYQTQLTTLQQEHSLAQSRIEHIVADFNQLLDTVYKKNPPTDELTADDLKSMRVVLHNQMNGRKEDSKKFEKLLDENRRAYLEAVELLQQQQWWWHIHFYFFYI